MTMSALRSQNSILTANLPFILTLGLVSRVVIYLLAYSFNYLSDAGRPLSGLMCFWDCDWYLSIINDGYALQPSGGPEGNAANWGFFPLFPIVSRALALATGLSPVVAAQVVSNAAFLIGLIVLFAYCLKYLDAATSNFVVAAFAFAPYSLYFSAPYTEAVYFALMIGSIFLASEDRWLWAGLLAAALSATRPPGFLIFFPLLAIAVQQYGFRSLLGLHEGTERAILALFLAPLGLFLFMLFLYVHVGDALASSNVQFRVWGHSWQNPLELIWFALASGVVPYVLLALCSILSLAAGFYLLLKRFPAEALILVLGTLLPLSMAPTSIRYTLTLYPLFIALGLLTTETPRARLLIICTLPAFLGFMVISWVIGAST